MEKSARMSFCLAPRTLVLMVRIFQYGGNAGSRHFLLRTRRPRFPRCSSWRLDVGDFGTSQRLWKDRRRLVDQTQEGDQLRSLCRADNEVMTDTAGAVLRAVQDFVQ